MTPDSGDRSALEAALHEALARIGGDVTGWTAFALGWATVELDRTEERFRAILGDTFAGATDGPDDVALGARCRTIRTIRTADDDRPVVVLLEPSTEGRLAATLARHGEGPAAVWLRAASALQDVASTPGRSVPAAGPFGTEVLLLDALSSGPHRLLVLAEAGTITP
jgi:hypothetical protein